MKKILPLLILLSCMNINISFAGLTYEQMQKAGYSTRKDNSADNLNSFLRGLQKEKYHQQTRDSRDLHIAQQKAYLESQGYTVKRKTGLKGFLSALGGGNQYEVTKNNY